MNARMLVPLIDLVFLTLGSVLAAMTHMERVEAIPVQVATVGQGASAVQRDEPVILALTEGGLTLGEEPLAAGKLASAVAGKRVILRAQKTLPTQRTLAVLAEIVRAGADASLEVESQPALSQSRSE
ncbi:MAG: biopolymer transporter ExbD [Phycisphaerae bacterium]